MAFVNRIIDVPIAARDGREVTGQVRVRQIDIARGPVRVKVGARTPVAVIVDGPDGPRRTDVPRYVDGSGGLVLLLAPLAAFAIAALARNRRRL